MTLKIAFGYKQHVGKDTACDYLVKQHGGAKLSFAELRTRNVSLRKGKDRRFDK